MKAVYKYAYYLLTFNVSVNVIVNAKNAIAKRLAVQIMNLNRIHETKDDFQNECHIVYKLSDSLLSAYAF